MFTFEQIKENLSKVRTGADFPTLAMNLKNIGVTYYETNMKDGRSIYHGQNGYELPGGPNYAPIHVADKINLEQLRLDIANHQQGKSDYFQISRQSAANGIEKWAVCLISMTCTYIDKSGKKVWVEQIPDASNKRVPFVVTQIKEAHSKVKSGADFPAYIQDIKKLGVTHYETFVATGNTDYYGSNDYKVSSGPRYELLSIADISNKAQFKSDLKAHQQGKTSYIVFCNDCATLGIEKWVVCMEKMTCTYFDKAGHELLVEQIPH